MTISVVIEIFSLPKNNFYYEVETFQILGVEMSTGGSTELNVRSFEAFLAIYLSIGIIT
jgi:hypothetical protein